MHSARRALVVLSLTAAGLVGVASPPASAQALDLGPEPIIEYGLARKASTEPNAPERRMVFVNNPEILRAEDLADDASPVAVYSDQLVAAGHFRDFFEHTNGLPAGGAGGDLLGYGILLQNTSAAAVQVAVQGQGFVTKTDTLTGYEGGIPFRKAFAGEGARNLPDLAPGERAWLFSTAVASSGAVVPRNSFFSGVVDFSTSGPVRIQHVAFRDARNVSLTTAIPYQGFITRQTSDPGNPAEVVEDGRKVYKGLMDFTAANLDGVDYTVDDTNLPGRMLTQYPIWTADDPANPTTWTIGTTPQPVSGWFTNISPFYRKIAVGTDMVPIDIPVDDTTRTTVDALHLFQPPGGTDKLSPNLGNWGVVYTVRGRLTNGGDAPRSFAVALERPAGAGLAVATKCKDEAWQDHRLAGDAPTTELRYCTVTVPPHGWADYSASFVNGGPSAGNLRQSLRMVV